MCLLAACASPKQKDEVKPIMPAAEVKQVAPVAEVKQADAPIAEAKPESTLAITSAAAQPAIADTLNDPNNILAQRSTHYPFDVSVVQSADLSLVQAHAKYLKAHPDRKVRLEGNCDERGSKKYNRKLGQRRAEGVKKILLEDGVMASQIETVSYGEEKPKLTCHKKNCWKENRRTDMNYVQ